MELKVLKWFYIHIFNVINLNREDISVKVFFKTSKVQYVQFSHFFVSKNKCHICFWEILHFSQQRIADFFHCRFFSETLILSTMLLLLSKSAWVKWVVFVDRRQMRIVRNGRNQIFLSINPISVKGVRLQKRLGVITSSYLSRKSHFVSCKLKRQPRFV